MSHMHRQTLAWTAALALGACLAAAGGCKKKDAAEKAATPPATQESPLAHRLNSMPASAQIDTLRALVAADSANAQLQFFAGNAYYEYGSNLESSAPNREAYLDSATTAYHRAVEIDSTMSKAYVNLALAYQEHRQVPEARKALEQAIRVNPNDVLAYCHLGFLSHQSGNLSDAMAQYKKALAIDPNSAQAHYNLGLAFAESKIFGEALKEWELVVKSDPDGDLGKTAAENVRIIQQYMAK